MQRSIRNATNPERTKILQRQRNSATKRSEGNRGQHGTLAGFLRNRLRRRVVPSVGPARTQMPEDLDNPTWHIVKAYQNLMTEAACPTSRARAREMLPIGLGPRDRHGTLKSPLRIRSAWQQNSTSENGEQSNASIVEYHLSDAVLMLRH
jgi:hypothetical protein